MRIDKEKFTRTLALYQGEFGSIIEWEVRPEGHKGYVQVSEPVEVTFKPLPDEDVLKEAVAMLNKQIDDVRAEAGLKVVQLEEKRQRLLAISHETS